MEKAPFDIRGEVYVVVPRDWSCLCALWGFDVDAALLSLCDPAIVGYVFAAKEVSSQGSVPFRCFHFAASAY